LQVGLRNDPAHLAEHIDEEPWPVVQTPDEFRESKGIGDHIAFFRRTKNITASPLNEFLLPHVAADGAALP
jgi:hypothetical protein